MPDDHIVLDEGTESVSVFISGTEPAGGVEGCRILTIQPETVAASDFHSVHA